MEPIFATVILKNQDYIFKQLSERHFLSFDTFNADSRLKIVGQYYNILDTLSQALLDEDIVLKEFQTLVSEHLSLKTPYIVFINEMHYFQNIIIEVLIENNLVNSLKTLINLFAKVNKIVAKTHLRQYIENLISVNNLRITSMADIIQHNVIKYYKSHLEWLNNLALSLQEQNINKFPEVNSALCTFGTWLSTDGKKIIHNNSKYKAITNLHDNLHMFGQKLYDQFDSKDYHLYLTYLEKCELLSLNIGTELALLDNILINDQMIKDPLTNALNRHAIAQIFANQYEISFATNNSFILAMCDIDHFKAVNDNFGHVAGDYMLQAFVRIVKEHLRNSDIVIRYGGEEFVILLPAVDQDRGFKIIENIRNQFSQFILEFAGENINTTVSIGMMEIRPQSPYHKSFLDDYIDIVDKKLYFAKQNGRNQTAIA